MRFMGTSKKPWIIVVLLIVLVAGGLFLYSRSSTPPHIVEHPEYLNFSGNYVIAVPQTYVVDELSLPGQYVLLYSGQQRPGTKLEDAYNAGAISLQPIIDMSDHNSSTFKKYVKETLIPEFKKNVSSDYQLKFSKFDGWDVARITAKKDGKPLRFVYVKNGQNPVAIVAKEESEAFKKIERTITDVETSDLKDDNKSLRQTILNFSKLVKDQKAADLYQQAVPGLKAKINQDQLATGLAGASAYTAGGITIYGTAYTLNPTKYSSVLVFHTNKDIPASTGALSLDKVNGQFKLQGLQLPSAKQ